MNIKVAETNKDIFCIEGINYKLAEAILIGLGRYVEDYGKIPNYKHIANDANDLYNKILSALFCENVNTKLTNE